MKDIGTKSKTRFLVVNFISLLSNKIQLFQLYPGDMSLCEQSFWTDKMSKVPVSGILYMFDSKARTKTVRYTNRSRKIQRTYI